MLSIYVIDYQAGCYLAHSTYGVISSRLSVSERFLEYRHLASGKGTKISNGGQNGAFYRV